MKKLIFVHSRYLAYVLLIAGLSGCLAEPTNTSFTGPTGQVYHNAKCNVNPSKCFSQATAQCGGSYQVVDSESHAGGTLADIFPGPVTWYGMTYVCGPSDGKYPDFPFQGQRYASRLHTSC